MTAIDNIAIIGAGAWGTALANVLAGAGRKVTLLARSAHLAAAIAEKHENLLYLKGIPLHPSIRATHEAAALHGAQLLLLAVPAQFLRGTLKTLRPLLPPGVPLVNVAKGIEAATGLFPSRVVEEEAPGHPFAVLSGPTFADEVAKGLPAAATLATKDPAGRDWAVSLRGRTFRPYLSADVAGIEAGGALKNVVAIACGIVEGKGLGLNARAAVMTRGMAEIRRFGLARGAEPGTFLGLSGIGDLTLTCNSMGSRNFSLGAAIGAGKTMAEVLAARNTVAEGVPTAAAVAQAARKEKIEMPLCLAVDHILHGGGNVDEVIAGLLSRDLKTEAA